MDNANTDLLEWLTAFGTVGAVLVAVWALVAAQRSNSDQRMHQRLLERHRNLVELLAAFEQIQALRSRHYTEKRWEVDEADEALRLASATYVALLRASPEPLDLVRTEAFRHMPYGIDETERAVLAAAPRIGNPETEEDVVCYVRGEIVNTLNRVRAKMNAEPEPELEGWIGSL